jgi:polysaccharide export outer membrane protein
LNVHRAIRGNDVIKLAHYFKLAGLVLLLIPGTLSVRGAQSDQPLPKELILYIRQARERGVEEARIKNQLATIGWPDATVEQAIAYEKSGKAIPAGPDSTTAMVTPPAPQTASNPVLPVDPGGPAPGTPRVSADLPAGASAVRRALDDYSIGSGDTLQVSVWKEPELSVPSVVVRSDGKITLPLIKEVDVGGMTPQQAEGVITERIGKFITAPNVTVVVASVNSKKVYLIGAVRKEGALVYTHGMTVMQALGEGGGLTDYAKRKKIYILRTENGKEYRLDFNYEEVIRTQRMEQNVALLPGDTIVIPN